MLNANFQSSLVDEGQILTFFGTPCQSLQYFGLRLAKVYIEKVLSETCLFFQYTPFPISIQSIGAIDGGD